MCLAHGGGHAVFGAGRLDRGWQVRPESRQRLRQPPSRYLRRFWYDCLTHSESARWLLMDAAGPECVVFGSGRPAAIAMNDPVAWLRNLASLTAAEKDAILG